MSSQRPDIPATRSLSGFGTSESPTPPLVAGTRIGRYTLRRVIGCGGMGAVVYEAIQQSPQRLVAIKVLPLSEGAQAVDRFWREAEALALVKHPNVVNVFESGTDATAGGVAFMAMELVVGAQPLNVYVRERRASVTLRQRVELMIQVCGAVAEAHRVGLVHRDLKPGNVLVDANGVVKIVDFGLATGVNSEVFAAPLPATPVPPHGTPAFMSPEQSRGSAGTIDARSDVFSLGAMLFELLTGRQLRQLELSTGVTGTLGETVLTAAPMPPSRLNARLRGQADRVLIRALDEVVANRFADAGELEQALRDLLDDAAPPGGKESPASRFARFLRRTAREFPRATACAVITVAAAVGLISLYPPVFKAAGFGSFEPVLLHVATSKPPLGTFANVTMVTLDDAFDPQHVAEAMKLNGIEPDPKSRASMRRLHALVLKRLVDASAKAVAFDIAFQFESDGDADLTRAARNAVGKGVPVLSVARDWDEEGGTLPGFRDAFRFGGAKADVAEQAAWSVHLAHEGKPGDVVASLPLAAWLAARSPQTRWEIQLDRRTTLTARGFDSIGGMDAQGRPREKPAEILSIEPTTVTGPPDGVPTSGNPRDALLRVLIPDDAVLRRSTVRYADIVGPAYDPAALQAALDGRIAIVGDIRTIGERRYPYFDGRQLPAFYANAVGIEALGLVSRSERLTDGVALALALVIAASAGVGLAFFENASPSPRPGRRYVGHAFAVLAFAVVAAFVSVIAAWQRQWLLNPGPLLVAGVAGYFIFLAVRRSSRLPLT